MRSLNILFCLGTLATAAVLGRRQGIHSVGPDGKKQVFGYNFDLDRIGPPVKPVSMVDAKSRFHADSLRKVTRFGPFTLPAMREGIQIPTGDHSHGGSSGGAYSLPKALSDIIPGAPSITWNDVAKSYRQAAAGDFEAAMATMINVPLDREGNIIMRTLNDGFCTDCTVLTIKTDLVYEDGTRVDISNGVYLHHAVSFDLAWKEMVNWINLCPFENQAIKDVELFSYLPSSFKTPFTMFGNAAVDEFQQWFASPDKNVAKAGYYIGAEDRFMMQAEMINYTKNQKQIYVQFDYEYLQGKIGTESTMAILSTTGCFDGLGFYGNGTTGSVRSQGYKVIQDGTIVAARGHLHDGGDSMTVFLNGKSVCVSKAVYGTKMKSENGKEWTTISAMTDCLVPIPVNKGDTIALETKFDEVAHPSRESGGRKQEEMGVMQFTFVPKLNGHKTG